MPETLTRAQLLNCIRSFYSNRNSGKVGTPEEYRYMARHFIRRLRKLDQSGAEHA